MADTSVFRGIIERGVRIIDLTGIGSGATYVVSVEDAKYGLIKFIGSVTGLVVVAFPAVSGLGWHIWNAVTHTDTQGQINLHTSGTDISILDGAIATVILDDAGAPRPIATSPATPSGSSSGGAGVLLGSPTPPSWTIVNIGSGVSALTLSSAQASAYFLDFHNAHNGLVTVTFPALQGHAWAVRNASDSVFAIRCVAAGNAAFVDVNPGFDGFLIVDDSSAMTQILVKHGHTHDHAGSDPTAHGCVILLCAGFTPQSTGADVAEVLVPFDPNDGTTVLTWSVRRITLRVGTAGGAPVAVIQKSSAGNAAFGTGTTVGTLTMGSGDSVVSVTAALGTVASGDLLRFSVTTLATALNWTISVELGLP